MSTPQPVPGPVVPHIRISLLGRLGSSSGERFSYGVNYGRADGTGGAGDGFNNQVVFDDLAGDCVNFHARTATLLNSAAILETVKFAFIGANGKYTRDPYIANVVDTPGAIAGIPPAPQVALAVSLGTARRGPTGRGRFYLPLPASPPSAGDFTIPVGDANSVRDSAATFLNDLNNMPALDVFDYRVVIISSKGYSSVVTNVRVGRVLDTIRSRRTQLPESYGPPVAVT